MPRSVLLVHSPLVGPSTWEPSADLLRSHGYDVQVPDLTGVAEAPSPRWQTFVGGAVTAAMSLASEVVVVGHSGAGAFLPAIAGGLDGRVALLVFVDAVIPPVHGFHETPPGMGAMLDEQTTDGRLRRWLEWWPDVVVEDLLPDANDRAALLEDMPSLPRAFYDESVPVPDGWADWPCAYLKLSAAYDDAYAEAGQRGWMRAELDADHLAIRSRPDQVVGAMESLVRAMGEANTPR